MVPTAPAKQHTASSHRMHRTHRSLGGAEVSHRLHRGIQIFLAEIFSHRLHRTRRTLGHPPKCVLWEDTLLGWCSSCSGKRQNRAEIAAPPPLGKCGATWLVQQGLLHPLEVIVRLLSLLLINRNPVRPVQL